MNYLAHAYLSFGDPEVLTGNMISDFVKGKKKFDYPPRVLAGINLHRDIDKFTDDHVVTRGLSDIFRPWYGLYSSALMDIVYDHFLAVELAAAGNEEFEKFTRKVYGVLESSPEILPQTFNNILPYMVQHNWLFNYQFAWGIQRSLAGLVHRAAYLTESETAFELFNKKYFDFEAGYRAFFPSLKNFALEKFSDIH